MEHTAGYVVKREKLGMAFLDQIFGLEGKTALVTGGATGIGRMIATALVQAGATVMICSRKAEACEAVAKELNDLDAPGSAEGFGADVSTEDGVKALAVEVRKRTDVLHVLVNNSGVTWGEPYEDHPRKAWDRVLPVNVTALFELTRDLTDLLQSSSSADDPARVINIGSVMGTQPVAEGAYSYAVSKAAVHHLTRVLAIELAPRHITVNAFAPGPYPSRMTAFATATEEGRDKVGQGVPLGRVGRPEDMAGAALFLCGRGGAYTTGAVIPLDGGQHVQHGVALFEDA